jgi:hypothetical protein
MLFLLTVQMHNTHLLPSPFLAGICMLQQNFMPTFEAINWIAQPIFHSIENHARVHYFIGLGQMKGLDLWCDNS